MNGRPRVVLADDHPLVCSGLKAMLEPQYAVVATVHDGNDVLGVVQRFRPDLVLMDLSLPGQNGLTLTRLIKEREEAPRVVVVTMHADRIYVDEALRAGADGYLLKTAPAAELRRALAEVLSGHSYVAPELRSANNPPSTTPDTSVRLDNELADLGKLTERQLQVLRLVGKGFSSQEIANTLGISTKAIEYHRAGIRQTLAISSQAGLYRIATKYAEQMEGSLS